MSKSLPAITGPQLTKLLTLDGWQISKRRKKKARHGTPLYKHFSDRKRVTVVPLRNDSLPMGTLSDILGPKQTGLGRKGLQKLIKQHGIP